MTNKEYSLATNMIDQENVVVVMKYSGEAVSEQDGNIVMKYLQNDRTDMADAEKWIKVLLLAFMILKKYAARVQFGTKDGLNMISIADALSGCGPLKERKFK